MGKYKGKKVTVDGPFTRNSVDASRFNETLKSFQDTTGITIEYIGTDQFENSITQRVLAGYAPDIADIAQPSLLASLAETGKLIDLTTIINQDWLQQNYMYPDLLESTQMQGPQGRILAGLRWRFSVKSLVWYPTTAFEDAGYKVPQTWDEMLRLMDQMVANGITPWCIGIESGNATGWPATDWIEEIMLRTTSLDNYNKWTRGELKFESPEVKHAFELMSEIWQDKYIYGGHGSIVSTKFSDAPLPMFDNPPKCLLHKQSNFITGSFPSIKEFGKDYDAFYLPPIDSQYGRPILSAGDMMAMFNDRPEVRAVIQYMTLGESLKVWLNEGGTFSLYRDVPLIWYEKPAERKIIEEVVRNATSVMFDGSDLMPPPVGQGTFWKGMTDYVSGTSNIDQTLKEIDKGWEIVKNQ